MFSSLLQPNVGLNQITVKTIHSNLYFQFSHASRFSPNLERFLVNSVNAGSCMAVWLMTDEVLTERRAGWHAGRWRPWRLRGRPEIALLLHYSITSQLTSPSWLPLHHATAKVSWDGNNWTQRLWVTQPSRQQGQHSGIVQYPVCCTSRQTNKQP